MESLIFLEKRQMELMEAIRETLKRVPAHSAKPRVMMDLFDLDRDDSFAASCQILFKVSSEKILGIHSLGVIGTYLTGSLISGPFE